MPMSEGRILQEMLRSSSSEALCSNAWDEKTWIDDAVRLTNTPHISRDPVIYGLGEKFHLTWLERDTTYVKETWEVTEQLKVEVERMLAQLSA